MSNKAYCINFYNDEDIPSQEIVFAESEEDARRSISFLCEEDIIEVERRAQYDKYRANISQLNQDLYKDYWIFSCDECEREVSLCEEDEYQNDLDYYNDLPEEDKSQEYPPNEYNPQFDKNRVFCSPQCKKDWYERRDKINKLKEETQEMLEKKFPGSSVKYKIGNYLSSNLYFEISVPGLNNPVIYETNSKDNISIKESDISAYNIYKQSLIDT